MVLIPAANNDFVGDYFLSFPTVRFRWDLGFNCVNAWEFSYLIFLNMQRDNSGNKHSLPSVYTRTQVHTSFLVPNVQH